ncbi:MAG: hypothetical protein M3374_03860, partial [Pseudomonadota bacterium]|nr:hypothetical protein [Pseudomonadota bacterium]
APEGDGAIRIQPLPETAPASRYGTDAGLVSHRDYVLLADPDGVAIAHDLAFNSWLAAHEDPDNPLELGPMPEAAETGVAADGLEPAADLDRAGAGETQAETDDAR